MSPLSAFSLSVDASLSIFSLIDAEQDGLFSSNTTLCHRGSNQRFRFADGEVARDQLEGTV